jgi:hypothetical protein
VDLVGSGIVGRTTLHKESRKRGFIMTASASGSDLPATITVELSQDEALAVVNALFMCLRPNNVRPPFDARLDVDAMELGYGKIASPVSHLEGRQCARCGRDWSPSTSPWDAFGDPETGELELVCDTCLTAVEQATFAEHHDRLARYAARLYATPSWQAGPAPASGGGGQRA